LSAEDKAKLAPPPSAAGAKKGGGMDMAALSAMATQLAVARQKRIVDKAKESGGRPYRRA